MANLVFYDTDHRYELDGEQVPSVSELTRFISREIYGTVSQYTLDTAADRGSRVHKLCEALDKYGEIECPEDVSGYVMAYLKFLKTTPTYWQEIEKPHFHPDHIYAGTPDRVGYVDGERCIVDIKTSSALQKTLYTAQLNLYRKMLPESVDKLYILHLHKDATYKLVELPISDDLADACITLHQTLKRHTKKPRRKKGESK